MSGENAHALAKFFHIHAMTFAESGEGEVTWDGLVDGEVTDSGDGFVEIAYTFDDERRYFRFRVSDLKRAIKEFTP